MEINQVYDRLVKDGYPNNAVTKDTAERLCALKGKAADLLNQWMSDNIVPEFEPINGVGSEFLVSKLGMKSPAVIIALAMLEDAPRENSEYFKRLANGVVGFYPNVQS